MSEHAAEERAVGATAAQRDEHIDVARGGLAAAVRARADGLGRARAAACVESSLHGSYDGADFGTWNAMREVGTVARADALRRTHARPRIIEGAHPSVVPLACRRSAHAVHGAQLEEHVEVGVAALFLEPRVLASREKLAQPATVLALNAKAVTASHLLHVRDLEGKRA